MKESEIQSKVIKYVEKELQGVAINGIYTKIGVADLMCGIPLGNDFKLVYTALEIKTPKELDAITSRSNISVYAQKSLGFRWDIENYKDEHVMTQLMFLNKIRDLGGRSYIICSVDNLRHLLS